MRVDPLPRARLSTPSVSARVSPVVTSSTIARLIASGVATTNTEIIDATGLGRSIVTGSLEQMARAGVIRPRSIKYVPGRGRNAVEYELAPEAGLVLVADVGDRSLRLAVAGLDQKVLAEHRQEIDVRDGPESTLDLIAGRLEAMIESVGLPHSNQALAVALPGRADREGVTVSSVYLEEDWGGFPVAGRLSERLSCHVTVEDVSSVRALGEARVLPSGALPLLFAVADRGIGTGIVGIDGTLHEGASGSAGSVAHMWVGQSGGEECSCGREGCLDSIASGEAILKKLGRLLPADSPTTMPELAQLIRKKEPNTIRAVEAAAESLGATLSALVTFYNPATLVLDGTLAWASDDALNIIRSVVYRRAAPLATRDLVINKSTLQRDSGLIGCMVLSLEYLLSPENLDRMLRSL